MRNLRPLTAREARHIVDIVNEQYGTEHKLDYYFLVHEREKSVFLVSRSVAQIDLESLRVNSLGSYFGELNDDETVVRLSIEGSQIIGPTATKNVLTLDKDTFKRWAKGEQMPLTPELQEATQNLSGYIIIKNDLGDFMGCARVKNNELLNFTPKNRRIASDS